MAFAGKTLKFLQKFTGGFTKVTTANPDKEEATGNPSYKLEIRSGRKQTVFSVGMQNSGISSNTAKIAFASGIFSSSNCSVVVDNGLIELVSTTVLYEAKMKLEPEQLTIKIGNTEIVINESRLERLKTLLA